MKKIDNIIGNKIIQNLFLWFVLYLIFTTAVQSGNRFAFAFYIIALLAPAIYVNNLFILKYLRKNIITFFILFFVNAIAFSAISVFLIGYFEKQDFNMKMFINFTGIMILAVAFGSVTKIARDSFMRRQQDKEAELQLLKGQLNPHFLFNTLNNLYGLSVIKSDKLPNLMLKLSDLLRYSLYETKETYVNLESEIKYLENYISLEKIRLEDKTEITFKKEGDFYNKKIAPMLLIVFVENAFKHLDLTNKNSEVIVEINIKDNQLKFSCKNTFDVNTNQNLEKGKSGIGLQNAKKRLDLIYPNKHLLKIEKGNENYTVNLILDL
jgi:LytS/YehU family sensor histidine kinase